MKFQKFGRFLSGMVIPNIGVFVAWGLITALFIPTGWFPNENIAKLVTPIITYVLPLLIGYTGGKIVYGKRGALMGVLGTIGVIVGSTMPMFLGAMIIGPIGALIIKYFDNITEGKIKSGFEMLVNNFSIGIIGGALAVVSFLVVGPLIGGLSIAIAGAMKVIVKANLLPLSALVIEPAKILFLNNAVDHGILGPIGVQQAKIVGKSILFLLVTNPGPGLGVLLSYWVYSKGNLKESVPGAIIIHFLGGIHEIYFPYVLMNPLTLIGVIAGGAAGTFTFTLFKVGLVATPSPGSIFAVLAMTPKGNFTGVILGVIIATIVSFLVCSIFVRRESNSEEDFEKAKETKNKLKGNTQSTTNNSVKATNVKNIYVACDAGMGSSAMAAAVLQKKINAAGLHISVKNVAIQNIPDDADIVVTHIQLTQSAIKAKPDVEHISITNYIKDPKYDELVKRLSSK
ncbi:PTS mannitol transporter subunit IICBA [Clostridium psychrophilum]|nr:PTS mannitol transporter subunit IICBA [Clostridium psychrophilum]